MKTDENPMERLEIVIKDSGLNSMLQDYSELAIDGLIDDGFLKEMPLIGSIVGLIKFGNSLRKHSAAKKLYKFLFQIHSIPTEKRIAKINEINNSQKYQSSVGEMILELLD